jgi:hypothetical protein
MLALGTVPLVGAMAAAMLLADVGAVAPSRLRPETVRGWESYVRATEARRNRELTDRSRFLATAFDSNGDQTIRTAMTGGMPIREVAPSGNDATGIDVPGGTVHHWRGVVFVPRASVASLFARLQTTAPARSEDVLAASVLEPGPDTMRVYLRLKRSKIVTVVYDTEHSVRLTRNGPGRASSTSIATRIAEVADPGTSKERHLAPGDDHGFLWRLNAYWRFEDAPGGVIAECESVSLSRGVPSVLRLVAGRVIRGAARESMERTLESFKKQYAST